MQPPRLPPHGKQFAEARARGLIPRKLGLGHLVATLDWNEPSGAMPHIIIPPGTDPARLNLAFVAGLHIAISHTDRHAARVPAVVDALLVAGAAVVDAVNCEGLARGEGMDSCWPRYEREALRHAA